MTELGIHAIHMIAGREAQVIQTDRTLTLYPTDHPTQQTSIDVTQIERVRLRGGRNRPRLVLCYWPDSFGPTRRTTVHFAPAAYFDLYLLKRRIVDHPNCHAS